MGLLLRRLIGCFGSRWRKSVWDNLAAPWLAGFPKEVARTYPFHPMLLQLAEQEWAQVAGFQRVRSTIRIFAATVYALQQRGRVNDWAPLLIGPRTFLSTTTFVRRFSGSGLVGDERTIQTSGHWLRTKSSMKTTRLAVHGDSTWDAMHRCGALAIHEPLSELRR